MRTLGLMLVAVALVGCSSSKEWKPEGTKTDAPKAEVPQAAPPKAEGTAWGEKAEGAHYGARLTSTPNPPKAGKTTFQLTLDHHGEPATSAKVRLELSMPGMSMGGPQVNLTHVGKGVYQGSATLPMGGEYQADLLILGEGAHGDRFAFVFTAIQ